MVHIKVSNVTKAYKNRVILDNISLDINKGEIFGFIGMSGSGKTTFLNSLIGFLEPEMGDILFLSSKDNKFKSIYSNQFEVRSSFGFATQEDSFYPKLTIAENLSHFGSLYHLPKSVIKKNVSHLLDLTGLTAHKDLLAEELSGGMKKKLSLACSIIHKPSVLILDEPTSDLDPLSRIEAWEIIKGINKIGTTIIVASHFLDELESFCDRVAILFDSKIMAFGTPEEVKKKYFVDEEIHLTTNPGNYDKIVKVLSRYHSLNIKNHSIIHNKLVFHTPKSEALLHQLLHVIERMDEKLLNVHVTKPSLTEVFESFKKR